MNEIENIKQNKIPLWKKEFPGFVLDVEIPKGFEDVSWHNDACPSWSNDKLKVVLNVDHGDVRKSEFRDSEEEGRFVLSWFPESIVNELGEWDYYGFAHADALIVTDDFKDIVDLVALLEVYHDLGFSLVEGNSNGVALQAPLDNGCYIQVQGKNLINIPNTIDEDVNANYLAQNGVVEASVTACNTKDLVAEIKHDLLPIVPSYEVTVEDGNRFHVRNEGWKKSSLKGVDGKALTDFEKPCVIETSYLHAEEYSKKKEYPSVYHALLEMNRERFERQMDEHGNTGIYLDNAVCFTFEDHSILNPFVDVSGRFDIQDPIQEYGSSLKNFLKELPLETREDQIIAREQQNTRYEKLWEDLQRVPIYTDIHGDDEDHIGEGWHSFKKGTLVLEIYEWIDKYHSKGVTWLSEQGDQQIKEHSELNAPPLVSLYKGDGYYIDNTECGMGFRKDLPDKSYIEIYGKKHDDIPQGSDELTHMLYFRDDGNCRAAIVCNDAIQAIYEAKKEVLKYGHEMSHELDIKVSKMLLQEGHCGNSVKGVLMEYSPNVPNRSDDARNYLNRTVKDAEKGFVNANQKKGNLR